MSFSAEIKEELCRIENERECCAKAELAMVLFMNITAGTKVNMAGTITPTASTTTKTASGKKSPEIRMATAAESASDILNGRQRGELSGEASEWPWIVTENAAFARRLYNLVRKLYQSAPNIQIRKNKRLKKNASYLVQLCFPDLLREQKNTRGNKSGTLLEQWDGLAELHTMASKKCCRKAMLRAAFLSAGSVSDPEKLYHFEIPCKRVEVAELLTVLMNRFSLNPKIITRNGFHIVYIKESGSIVDFLNITGAHKALMSLENTRILKEMRNSVNRIVNCETANVGKTVDASVKQIENITFIQENFGLDNLPKSLRDIAEARIANKEIGLKELGQILDPPLGKSGVNHRLRKLNAIAEELRC